MTSVAVIGANGQLGQPTIDAVASPLFSSHYQFPIKVLTRDASASKSTDTVQYLTTDYSNVESISANLQGVDTVIDLRGGPALGSATANNKLADAAAAANVKVFFSSMYGLDYFTSGVYSQVFQNRTAMVEYAQSRGLKVVQMPTGLFIDICLKFPILIDIANKKLVTLGDGTNKISMTSVQDVARALASLAHRPADDLPSLIRVYSDAQSQVDFANLYEKISGAQLDRTTVIPFEQIKSQADEAAALPHDKFDLEAFSKIINAYLAHPSALLDYTQDNHRELVNPGLWQWDTVQALADKAWSS